jgi:hypothetical protein
MTGHVACMGDMKNAHKISIGKPEAYLEGLGIYGTIRLKLIKEIRCEGVDRIRVAQDSDRWRALASR